MSDLHGYALAGLNLVSFDLATPNIAATSVPIVGLTAGETLVGIDFRPANGLLYGLGVNAGADTATLYVISTRTGVAGSVGSIAGVGDLPPGNFGFDFNPSVDRIRVTTDTGLNFRLNPNSGAIAGVDTSIPAHDISGVAYTNNRPDNGNITTLYALDALSDFLNVQNPPNGGVQNPVGPLGVDFSNANGFDIPRGVDAPANNAVISGTGYALLTVAGTVGLYGVDLLSGAATLVGTFLDGVTPTGGFAIQNNSAGIPVVALTADGTTLVRFDSAAPATLAGNAISGIAAGETLVGIDYRPLTGELYGLAVNDAADTGTLYLLQVGGGAATAVGVPGGIAFVSGGGAVDLPAGGYGMDFDPTIDRIRITTESGLNFRIDPTGAPVDGDVIATGTNPDIAINGLATGASATAYTNSFGQLPGGPTTQYTLDSASDTLFIQNSSFGTLSAPHAVTLNGSPLDFASVTGFDIPGGVTVTSSGSPAIGFGYAGLTVGGVTGLYRIDLASGAATDLGAIGTGTTQLTGLALGNSFVVPVITSDGGGATANVFVGENGAAVTTVVATDADGPSIAYSITGGADAARFQIDAATGALAFIAAPDFEAPTDADHNNSYFVQVRASDGSLFDDQTITVSVANSTNEAAPTITSNGGGDSATVLVAENTTAITVVSATDTDAGTTLAYSIAGGVDAGKFAINSSTGALAFIGAPDFEAPADSDHNNSYFVQVRASDGSLFDDQTITVSVSDAADVLTGTSGDDSFMASPGTQRIDADGGIDTVTFGFRLVDATVTYAGREIIIDSASSHTVLTGFETFVFTDGTVNNNDGSWLIDDLYYNSQYHDVWNAHVDADAHFNLYGWHEFRNPNAFFDTGVYLSLFQDVKASGVNPLSSFDTSGWIAHRIPSFNFDPDQYLLDNPDVAAAGVDPLEHFLHFGAAEGRLPTAPAELIAANGFDYVYYLQHNPDVRAAHVDPFEHFQSHGWLEGRNPNALFDTNGYLANYPDVAAAHINPLDHFHLYGWTEGRDPSVNFDSTDYLSHYPDVAAAHIDPLKHFLQDGIHEGRSPFADGLWG